MAGSSTFQIKRHQQVAVNIARLYHPHPRRHHLAAEEAPEIAAAPASRCWHGPCWRAHIVCGRHATRLSGSADRFCCIFSCNRVQILVQLIYKKTEQLAPAPLATVSKQVYKVWWQRDFVFRIISFPETSSAKSYIPVT